jgi:hypothetical protein
MALRKLINSDGDLKYSVSILSAFVNDASKGDIVLYGITLNTASQQAVVLLQNGQCPYTVDTEKTWSFTSDTNTHLVIQLRNRQGNYEQLVLRTYPEFMTVMNRVYSPVTIVDRCRDYVSRNRVVVYEYIADLLVRAIDIISQIDSWLRSTNLYVRPVYVSS